MTTLTHAHNEWASRRDDEKFSSLRDLHRKAVDDRAFGVETETEISCALAEDGDVKMFTKSGEIATFTNWSFGQLCSTLKPAAPASYLQGLSPPLAADCINEGLAKHDIGKRQFLFTGDHAKPVARAMVSDSYSRIWNAEITSRLLELEADGPWQPAPAAFDGSRGLYLGDRDMFAFMVDSGRRIFEHAPGGGLSRGFFVANSEVGARSFMVMTFLYEYVCGNHRVWGASQVKEIRIRHVGKDVNAKAFSGLHAELVAYAESSAADDELKISAAMKCILGPDKDGRSYRLFGLRVPGLAYRTLNEAYDLAEQRVNWYGNPRSAWGMSGALTEIARDKPNADDRVALEMASSKVLEIAH